MITEIRVPKVGGGVKKVKIASWFVKQGEEVELDQPVVELETDKVNMELPSPASGSVSRILFGEGETVKVGELIGLIADGQF